jgi:hypothetical protein
MFQQLLTDTGKEISTGIVYLKIYKNFNQTCDNTQKCDPFSTLSTRGSQEPAIAHLVFNLTSKVDRKWGCYT